MNALLCKPCVMTDAQLDIYAIPDLQEDFATTPLQAIRMVPAASDEEELHMAFENAIAQRISTIGVGRSQADSLLASTGPLRDTSVKRAVATLMPPAPAAPVSKSWLRSISYICLPFMCMLAGFDFLGLLMLHLH